jgi:lipoprotein NlpI
MRRHLRPALAGVVICGACVATCPAGAQVQPLIDSCGRDAGSLSASTRIEACTALIQSGGVFGQGLSWAYENRCSAYVGNGQPDLAIADCNEAIESDPTSRAYVSRGNAFYARGDADQAIGDYNRAIGLDAKDAAAYVDRGRAFYAKGDNDRAIADYTQAIQLDRSAHPYNSRGDAYLAKGDNEHAIADYDRVIELDKNNPRVYLKRGVANLYMGAAQKAAVDLARSSELDPHDPYTALWLDILGKRSRGQLAKTATSIDMNKWPAPIISLYLGKITPADLNAAAGHADPAVKKAQTCEANFYGGKLASQRGKKDEARRLFETAAAECPKSFIWCRQFRTENLSSQMTKCWISGIRHTLASNLIQLLRSAVRTTS